jgi:dCMP deaminase
MMSIALVLEQQSTCDRNHVGAVIAKDGRIISTGYNGVPAGMPHCQHIMDTPASRRAGCRVAIHAEGNAIAYAARHGVAVESATIYTTLSPCYACAQIIIAAGLVRVVYGRTYRDTTGIDLVKAAGLELVHIG